MSSQNAHSEKASDALPSPEHASAVATSPQETPNAEASPAASSSKELVTPRKQKHVSAGSPDAPAKSSPASSKRARGQRRKANHVAETPGKRENIKGFLSKHWEGEGRCAAYLGFKNIADLRRFAMSPWTLKFFNQMAPDRQNVRQNNVLELLRDCSKEMESDGDAATIYPKDLDKHVDFRVALIVAQATREIQNARSGSVSVTQDDVEKHCLAFDKIIGKKSPRIAVSETQLRFPELGPFTNLGECDLECFLRVFNILKYVAFSVSTAVWDSRFGSESWQKESLITESHVPDWMKPKGMVPPPLLPDMPIKPPQLAKPEKPALELRISWKYDSNLVPPTDYRRYIEDEEPDLEELLPTFDQKIRLEPEANRSQFQDSIRRLFSFPDLHAQIYTLRLELKEAEGDGKQNISIPKADWIAVQESLWGGRYDLEKSAFSMTVRKADPGEVIWESTVPLEVQQVMTIKDGDVIPIAPATEDPRSDPTDGIVHALRDHSKERIYLDPLKLFPDRKEDMVRFYNGHDASTEDGLRAWQMEVSDKICANDERKIVQDDKVSKFGKQVQLSAAERAAVDAARAEGGQLAFNLPDSEKQDDDKDIEESYYTLNQIHTGTGAQVGLPLEPSAKALELEAFTDSKGRRKYRSNDPALRNCAFYPWQVTGVTTCLVGAIGYVPVRSDAPDDVKKAAESLKGLAIGGKMIVDQTGLGKSLLLLALYFYGRGHEEYDSEKKRVYKIILLVVPSAVLKQWADELLHYFPDMALMISYDEGGMGAAKYKRHIISATAMKEYPGNKQRFPKQFHYIFDPHDARTGRTVLLTSNDCLVTRTLKKERQALEPDENGKEREKITYRSVLFGKVGLGGIDEGHKLKDDSSKRWMAYFSVHAPVTWILGATPMSNTSGVSYKMRNLVFILILMAIGFYRPTQAYLDWYKGNT